MDTYRTPSPADRDAALRRLRTVTIASALAGAAAVVTFGTAAAISNPGHQSTASGGGTTSDQTGQSAVTGNAGGDTTATGTATPTPATDSFFGAPAQLPVITGGGQTTTGGS